MNKQDIYNKARSYVEKATAHMSYLQFQTACKDDMGCYHGYGQWLDKDRKTVEGRGQSVVTYNITQGFIDSLSGVERQSKYRMACKSDSFDENDDDLASAITHLLYTIQQKEKITYKGSLKFRDMIACGIGWSNQYQHNGAFHYEKVDPLNVIPDYDDLSDDFSEMDYVCRRRWMLIADVKGMWPSKARLLSGFGVGSDYYTGFNSAEIMGRGPAGEDIALIEGGSHGKLLVWEVQYKEQHDAYEGATKSGRPFKTFDAKYAEDIAEFKNSIIETKEKRIMRTLFTNGVLLEHSPLDPDIPGMSDFSYIPCVWKRRYDSGVPFGLVSSIKDIQRELNSRMAKALYSINTTKLIGSGPLLQGSDMRSIKNELKQSDGLVWLPAGSNIQMSNNSQTGQDQLNYTRLALDMMKHVTGINDEMLGKETNATSAVAQKQRLVNSVRNNVFAFDTFASMKEREATFMVGLIQSCKNQNMISQVVSENERKVIILNLVTDDDGKERYNDILYLPLSLYIEEVPDYRSSKEELRATTEALANNPNASLLFMSPKLLDMFGYRNSEEVSKNFKEAMMEKYRIESGASLPQPQAEQAESQEGPPVNSGVMDYLKQMEGQM